MSSHDCRRDQPSLVQFETRIEQRRSQRPAEEPATSDPVSDETGSFDVFSLYWLAPRDQVVTRRRIHSTDIRGMTINAKETLVPINSFQFFGDVEAQTVFVVTFRA